MRRCAPSPDSEPSWSGDGSVVFLGIGKWLDAVAGRDVEDAVNPKKPPASDVWHWRDVDVMPRQKVSAKAERERNMLAALASRDRTARATGQGALTEQVTRVKHQRCRGRSLKCDCVCNGSEHRAPRRRSLRSSISRRAIRTTIKDRVDDGDAEAEPSRAAICYFLQDDHDWTINTCDAATLVNITKTAPTSFVNRESDFTIKQKPPFGVAGWTTNDESGAPLRSSSISGRSPPTVRAATRLTDGAAEQVRHRYVRLDPIRNRLIRRSRCT